MEQKYLYKISVIIPVYNTELYLKETIDSVLNQTMNFEENVQMILVNNASTDNSKEICKLYAEKYPDNIVYVELEQNQGPSGARNAGIPYIKGKYVNFLDSDDIWDKKAFDSAYMFLEQYEEEIDCVTCRVRCFDAYDKWHIYDYEYTGDIIKDIRKDYTSVQFACSPLFIKSSVIKNGILFDTNLKYCEDVNFINKVIIRKEKYGSLKSVIYYYRQRKNGTSQVQRYNKDKQWYSTILEDAFQYFVNWSMDKYGKVIPYFQYLIMSHLQGRLKAKIPNDISDDEIKYYKNKIKYFLQFINDEIIMQQRNISRDYKMYSLKLKYGEEYFNNNMYLLGKKFYFHSQAIWSIEANNNITIASLSIEENYLKLFGIINIPLEKNRYNLYIVDDKKNKYQLKLKKCPISHKPMSLSEVLVDRMFFSCNIPIKNDMQIRIIMEYEDINFQLIPLFGDFAKLNKKFYRTSYYHKNHILITTDQSSVIYIKKSNNNLLLKKEIQYICDLYKNKKKRAVIARLLRNIYKIFNKKEIWLITDRILTAGDCGEYLFNYIYKNNKNKNLDVYFVLSKESKDFDRIKKIGKVVQYRSLKHKVLFLMASKIISSLTNEWVYNVTSYIKDYVKDLYDFQFIHIQHGVIKDDISGSINKYNKNIRLFVTSGQREYESMLNYPYGYEQDEIILTGLPRFDSLNVKDIQKNTKIILIAPTWRQNLTGQPNYQKDIYEYNPHFKETEYYKFYESLINNERLLGKMKELGFKGEFKLHPMLGEQSIDFESNEIISIASNRESNNQSSLNRYDILITDYSSIAFDCAYIGMPVVYTQFDKIEFFDSHTYQQGYFEYERDGFGPVCEDLDSTVNAIIRIMENNCILDEKYSTRRKEFFKYIDHNNSKRVYESIMQLP